MKKLLTLLMLCNMLFAAAQSADNTGTLTITPENTTIVVAADECGPVQIAVEALRRDFGKVMAFEPETANATAADAVNIVVVNDQTEASKQLADIDDNPWGDNTCEAHSISVEGNNIVLRGMDMRGTIYAIYTFSEKFLGVPPLWYWCDWQPEHKDAVSIATDYAYFEGEPTVRYRAWFPNDEDLFIPWRARSAENNELWLETMLRLKLNTVEYTATVTTQGTLNSEAQLYKKYGLVLTSHHMVALNNSFANWDAYWREVRSTTPPTLSINDLTSLKEFWQYSIDAVKASGVENLWQVAFRGKTDQPFWAIFSDAPTTDAERGKVISDMVKTQYDMICESTGETDPFVRMTFYDEISSLLAAGHIQPPTASNMLWTFVAGRRDHYPYDDLVEWQNTDNVKLGYYMNLQFYSTGAHLAPAEGPWKMEDNYRYVQSKGPLTFSVVNAGNLREFLMEMSANAAMMWNSDKYSTDAFLLDFCSQYYGAEHAAEAAQLTRDYYNAYWNQKQSDFPGGFDRQYIFQDLRHAQVIKQIDNTWATYKDNPLTEIGYESVPGRTFRIEGDNQVQSIIDGTAAEMEAFADVARRCDELMPQLPADRQTFFYDHLSAYAHYMAHLSAATHYFVRAYKENGARYDLLATALKEMKDAREALTATEHGVFDGWYDTDDKFDIDDKISIIRNRLAENEDLTLTKQLITNYDFELNHNGEQNPAGTITRGIPYGWSSEGELKKGANGLDSYGINQDASNPHATNVCWINSVPMPEQFTLYQTIPADKLEAGTYRIACRLWVEVNKKTSCRLFANNNVQYYGYESDYTNLLTQGETVDYAGYAGGNTSNIVLREMEVYVDIAEGDDLTFGIKTGNKRNNGVVATDNAGWFKVDFFRIQRVTPTAITSPTTDTAADSAAPTTYFSIDGRQLSADNARSERIVIEKKGNRTRKIINR